MEPERKIEKWLKAYAKKRRAQAGDSFKLHPATRRLLQSEVARDKPKPDDEDESVSLWEVIRQHWAILLSFAACIFLVGIILLPFAYTAKKKSQALSTLGSLNQIGAAVQMAAKDNNGKLPATLDELTTNGYLTRLALTDQESGQPFVYLGAGKDLTGLSTNAVLAYSPPEKGDRRAILLADGQTEFVDRDKFVQVTNALPSSDLAMTFTPSSAPLVSRSFKATPIEAPPGAPVAQPASAPVAAGGIEAGEPVVTQPLAKESPPEVATAAPAMPPASTPIASSGNVAPGQQLEQLQSPNAPAAAPLPAEMPQAEENSATFGVKQQYQSQFALAASRQIMGSQNTFQNSVTPAQTGPVLANFQVQQNGNAIRVVDQDGSIYEGSLQALGQQAQKNEDQAVNERLMQNAVRVATGLPVQKIAAARDALQIAQTYFFRVYGTNRTVRQPVVFTGNLMANFASATNAPALGPTATFSFGGRGAVEQVKKMEQTNQVAQLPWSRLRITGTATVNHTNQIQIDAAPVVPVKN